MNKTIFALFSLFALTSCSHNYSSSFGCPDAKGMNCRMMSRVDKAIDSGEIETVELKACKGKKCALTPKPEIKDNRTHRIKTYKESEPSIYKDGEYLYIRQN